MGVGGLWEVVAPHKESTSVEVLALGGGYRLGVDASLWMVQCEIALAKAPPTEQVNLVLLALVYKVFKLLSQGFLPCVVFDGPRRPSHKRGRKVNAGTMRRETHFREFLDIMGVPGRQAPGEAEAELAQMAMDGILDAVLSDDGDTLVFGCPVLIRNSSSGLTGNQGGASGSSSSQADKTTTRTPAVLYRLSDLEAAGLTRPGLILIAMLSGGDYMPQGLPSFGAVSATSLAKQGYGEKLLDGLQRTVGDQVGTGRFLAQWRDEVADELEKNPTGARSRTEAALAGKLRTANFPDLATLALYTTPVVSHSLAAPDWSVEPDIARLAPFLSSTFQWSHDQIIDSLRNTLWKGLLMRQLRLAALKRPGAEERLEKMLLAIHDKRKSNYDPEVVNVVVWRVELSHLLLDELKAILPCYDRFERPDPLSDGPPSSQPGAMLLSPRKRKVIDKSGRKAYSHWIPSAFLKSTLAGRCVIDEYNTQKTEKGTAEETRLRNQLARAAGAEQKKALKAAEVESRRIAKEDKLAAKMALAEEKTALMQGKTTKKPRVASKKRRVVLPQYTSDIASSPIATSDAEPTPRPTRTQRSIESPVLGVLLRKPKIVRRPDTPPFDPVSSLDSPSKRSSYLCVASPHRSDQLITSMFTASRRPDSGVSKPKSASTLQLVEDGATSTDVQTSDDEVVVMPLGWTKPRVQQPTPLTPSTYDVIDLCDDSD